MTVAGSLPAARTGIAARLVVVALVTVAIALVVLHSAYRTFEIVLAGALLEILSPHGVEVAAARQTVYFGLGTDNAIGLKMTPECTSAFLVLPLLLVGAAMIWLRPRIAGRVLRSLLIAAAALVVVNQLRILTLVGLVEWLGRDEGYYWGHTLLGSMVSVFGGAAALVLFVWQATRGGRPA